MTHYNILKVKVFTSRLHKLKSAIKNGTEVTWKPSSNVVDDYNHQNIFLHILILSH